MRSRTANWFECKIRYEKVMDDGLQKKVTESYVVDALSFSEAEEIFRKQFTKAAEQIISKVYNKDQMNGSEKDFTINAQKMTNELVSKKDEIMKSTAINSDRAEAIADKIIEQLTEKKKAELDKDYYGIKKQKNNNEK